MKWLPLTLDILNESLDTKSNKIKINTWSEIRLQLKTNLDSYCTSNISLAYNLCVHGWILYTHIHTTNSNQAFLYSLRFDT